MIAHEDSLLLKHKLWLIRRTVAVLYRSLQEQHQRGSAEEMGDQSPLRWHWWRRCVRPKGRNGRAHACARLARAGSAASHAGELLRAGAALPRAFLRRRHPERHHLHKDRPSKPCLRVTVTQARLSSLSFAAAGQTAGIAMMMLLTPRSGREVATCCKCAHLCQRMCQGCQVDRLRSQERTLRALAPRLLLAASTLTFWTLLSRLSPFLQAFIEAPHRCQVHQGHSSFSNDSQRRYSEKLRYCLGC